MFIAYKREVLFFFKLLFWHNFIHFRSAYKNFDVYESKPVLFHKCLTSKHA